MYSGSITIRCLVIELGPREQQKFSLMCTYHFSTSVRLDSNINLSLKLGRVVWLKPDLLTLGIYAKPTNFAFDFRIHISISEKNPINSKRCRRCFDQFRTLTKFPEYFQRLPSVAGAKRQILAPLCRDHTYLILATIKLE